jgi:hypothetical protein
MKTHHGSRRISRATHRPSRERTDDQVPLAKFLSAKALAAMTAVCLTGGVAAAASTGVLSSSASAHAHVAASQPVSSAGKTSRPLSGVLDPAQLCRNLASQVAAAGSDANAATGQVLSQAGIAQALASPDVALGQPEWNAM